MKAFFTFLLFLLLSCRAFAQQIVDVAELTVRLAGNEEKLLHYAFAKGDQILFTFEEADHKTLKEFSVAEAATDTKRFEDYETSAIPAKTLNVAQTGVYKFRLYNSATFKGRVCKLRIQRKPATPELAGFNTAVKWIAKSDTTFNVYTKKVVTGYREYEVQKTRKVLAKVDTTIIPLADRVERVHSINNPSNPNSTLINFSFPTNTAEPNLFNPYKTSEVVSWAYSLAVGDSGEAWYKNANKRAAAASLIRGAIAAGAVSGGTGAIAVLAIQGVSLFSNPPAGDNVLFSFLFKRNEQIYKLTDAQGNSVAASGRVTNSMQGGMTLRLENDNQIDAINVNVKLVAVVVTKLYRDEPYTVKKSDPIEEMKTIKEPKVTVRQVPVVMN